MGAANRQPLGSTNLAPFTLVGLPATELPQPDLVAYTASLGCYVSQLGDDDYPFGDDDNGDVLMLGVVGAITPSSTWQLALSLNKVDHLVAGQPTAADIPTEWTSVATLTDLAEPGFPIPMSEVAAAIGVDPLWLQIVVTDANGAHLAFYLYAPNGLPNPDASALPFESWATFDTEVWHHLVLTLPKLAHAVTFDLTDQVGIQPDPQFAIAVTGPVTLSDAAIAALGEAIGAAVVPSDPTAVATTGARLALTSGSGTQDVGGGTAPDTDRWTQEIDVPEGARYLWLQVTATNPVNLPVLLSGDGEIVSYTFPNGVDGVFEYTLPLLDKLSTYSAMSLSVDGDVETDGAGADNGSGAVGIRAVWLT